jgi:hypothetical protein
VARFLGYDGSIELDALVLMTRPPQVKIDPRGLLRACVTRATPQEDGVRLELELQNGRLYTVSPHAGPPVGDDVGVRVDGGVRFPHG